MIERLLHELKNNGSIQFFVRAVPNAPKTKLIGVMEDESLKVAVAAPAEKGKANKELVRFLAEEFGVSKTNVEIVTGGTARMKLVKIVR